MSINRLCDLAHQNAVWKDELDEAYDEHIQKKGMKEVFYRGQEPCGIPIELADCIILIMSTCGRYGIDLAEAIRIKMEYNKTRPYKHGKE
jgi:NTP pyrophosphatase (non-canonical NTP hydrolase)